MRFEVVILTEKDTIYYVNGIMLTQYIVFFIDFYFVQCYTLFMQCFF